MRASEESPIAYARACVCSRLRVRVRVRLLAWIGSRVSVCCVSGEPVWISHDTRHPRAAVCVTYVSHCATHQLLVNTAAKQPPPPIHGGGAFETAVYVGNLAQWLARADEGLRGVDGIDAAAVAGRAFFVGDYFATNVRDCVGGNDTQRGFSRGEGPAVAPLLPLAVGCRGGLGGGWWLVVLTVVVSHFPPCQRMMLETEWRVYCEGRLPFSPPSMPDWLWPIAARIVQAIDSITLHQVRCSPALCGSSPRPPSVCESARHGCRSSDDAVCCTVPQCGLLFVWFAYASTGWRVDGAS